ncbi:hypothetical protein AFB00_25475 [Pseudonocardia sp. HH130630-07]|nr:hypothetical protein AFB00_25475 [Pseudonocardia sp. HH130630-07]
MSFVVAGRVGFVAGFGGCSPDGGRAPVRPARSTRTARTRRGGEIGGWGSGTPAARVRDGAGTVERERGRPVDSRTGPGAVADTLSPATDVTPT